MLSIDIPGHGALRLAHLVMDFNGTLAIDGKRIPGVKKRLRRLADVLRLHVVTADTFGRVRAELKDLPCEIVVLGPSRQDAGKAAYVRRLGAGRTACLGNGRNDRLMVGLAALGIVVIQKEGAAAETVRAADVLVHDVRDALDLLLHPLRLVASLRN
jgi:soluble P-type ATPase